MSRIAFYILCVIAGVFCYHPGQDHDREPAGRRATLQQTLCDNVTNK